MAHQRRIGASADRKPKSVDEQALAGASLAREHVEAWLEGDPKLLDQGQIANAQLCQPTGRHGGRQWLRLGRLPPTRVGRRQLRGLGLDRIGHEGSSSDF